MSAKRYRVQESLLPRAFTTDAILSAETVGHNPAMFGRRWIGAMTSQLGDLPADGQREVLDAARAALDAAYAALSSATMGPGAAGSFGTGPQQRDEAEFGSAEAMDRENKKFWGHKTPVATHDGPAPRSRQEAEIQRINALNMAFYATG